MKVETSFVNPPVPGRDSDWQATFDNYEPGHPIGYGPTEVGAVRDLMFQIDETPEQSVAVDDFMATKHIGVPTTCLITDADGITRRLSVQLKVF